MCRYILSERARLYTPFSGGPNEIDECKKTKRKKKKRNENTRTHARAIRIVETEQALHSAEATHVRVYLYEWNDQKKSYEASTRFSFDGVCMPHTHTNRPSVCTSTLTRLFVCLFAYVERARVCVCMYVAVDTFVHPFPYMVKNLDTCFSRRTVCRWGFIYIHGHIAH